MNTLNSFLRTVFFLILLATLPSVGYTEIGQVPCGSPSKGKDNGKDDQKNASDSFKNHSFKAFWKMGDATLTDVITFTENTASCAKLGIKNVPFTIAPKAQEPAERKKGARRKDDPIDIIIKSKDIKGTTVDIKLQYNGGTLSGTVTFSPKEGDPVIASIACDLIKSK